MMNKTLTLLLALSASFWLFSDDHTPEMPNFFPIEIQQCNFNGNNDMEDFMRHIDEWNDFLNEYSEYPYAGWVVTPHYRSAGDNSFDFGWLGGSNSWSSFGKIYDIWFEEAAALGAKFDKIRTCNTQTIFAAQVIRQSSPDEDSEGVMMVSNCSVSEGITPVDLAMADAKWNAYLDSNEGKGSIFRWYPAVGDSIEADYDFKNVFTASSMNEWGDGIGSIINEGGLLVQLEIYGEILSCDSPRLYQTNNVRSASN